MKLTFCILCYRLELRQEFDNPEILPHHFKFFRKINSQHKFYKTVNLTKFSVAEKFANYPTLQFTVRKNEKFSATQIFFRQINLDLE